MKTKIEKWDDLNNVYKFTDMFNSKVSKKSDFITQLNLDESEKEIIIYSLKLIEQQLKEIHFNIKFNIEKGKFD